MGPLARINWVVVGVVAVMGTALFLAGHVLYTHNALSRPLADHLQSQPGVLEAEVNTEAGRWAVVLTVERVRDWPELYRHLDAESRRLLGDRAFSLEFRDGRDQQLEDALHRIHFDLYEALATGRLSMLADLPAGADGYRLHLEVDADRLYVQMESQAGYLYEVIDRPRGGEGR